MLSQTGSAVFLADSPFYEWWYPLLRPWVHYIPVERALRDVAERVRWANALTLTPTLTITITLP